MPYTTIVTGTTITSSWANANVRDQVVTPFATTSARDSAITVPVKGMVAMITSNDTAEGLTTYTSANVWRKPWNMPWGRLAGATATADQGSITTAVDLTSLTITFTPAAANRQVRISATVRMESTVASDWMNVAILKDGSQIHGINAVQAGSSQTITMTAWVEDTPTAASHTYKLQASRVAGTGTLTSRASATTPASIVADDVGPSGAPA